ncbi:DUF2975 domain-containing protein [Lactococcus taiwanensis]|uniref:DUF2975 domain-containing protein n=1 Tax=Lactococcus taiwanensis TaxID=1151742 RepID=UPI00190761D0|nr:DUF2975 domain-containing protein [Lactococcus taiwanensis]
MKIKTNPLKLIIAIIMAFIIFLFGLLAIGLWNSFQSNDIYFSKILFYLCFFGALIFALISLSKAYTILILIDKDIIFTREILKIIIDIKRLTVASTIVLIGILPMVYHIIELTHFYIVLPISLIFICSPLVLSTFTAVIQQLLLRIIDIKSENDLTV